MIPHRSHAGHVLGGDADRSAVCFHEESAIEFDDPIQDADVDGADLGPGAGLQLSQDRTPDVSITERAIGMERGMRKGVCQLAQQGPTG